MALPLLAALLLAAQSDAPINRPPGAWCRGIHMPTPSGGVNLFWTTFRGQPADLHVIAGRMRDLGVRVEEMVGEMRAFYQDDLDARSIGRLLNAVDRGELGAVTTEDYASSLDTLPADRCIRFRPN